MKRVKVLIKTGMIALLLMVITACGNGGKTKYTLEMAQNYLLEGNYEEAILAYTALIEIDPSDTSLYMQRADAYVYTEQYQNAIDDFTVVIQNEPENTEALLYRGSLYVITDELSAGETDLKEMNQLLSSEEKKALYDALDSYLNRLGVTEEDPEENYGFKIRIYALPGGGHLLIVQDGDNNFGIQILPSGMELPSLSFEDAMYYFDWYCPQYLWWDSQMSAYEYYVGPVTLHINRDNTVQVYYGEAVRDMNLYYGIRHEGEYLLDFTQPGYRDASHYFIYIEEGEMPYVIVGETMADNSTWFVPVIPQYQ